MEAKDRNYIQQQILEKYPDTDPEIDIDWDIVEISFKAGQLEQLKECHKALVNADGAEDLKSLEKNITGLLFEWQDKLLSYYKGGLK